jgi:predicted nuclease with TOPRIM domain
MRTHVDIPKSKTILSLKNPTEPVHRDDKKPTKEHPDVELEVLRVKTAMLEEQLGRERDSVEDLRRRLDRAEERVLALSAPTNHP